MDVRAKGQKSANTHYVEVRYYYNRASDAADKKWLQFNKLFWASESSYAQFVDSGAGMGYADVVLFTQDPGAVRALAKKIAKQLKMQVKCVVAPVD